MLEWLRPHLEKLTLAQIDTNKINEIKFLRANEPINKYKRSTQPAIKSLDKLPTITTVNYYLGVLRRVLRKAHQKGWISGIPHIEKFSNDNARVRWLTYEKAENLLNTLPEYLADMVKFSLATGLREANVRLLKWEQIDMSRAHAFVAKENVKNKKAISIPLNKDALSVLKKQKQINDYVFNYHEKPLYRCTTTAWFNALKKCGIENFKWHDLRHTWASWHIQNGTSLQELQVLGGWSDFKMVLRYAHLSSEQLKSAAERIARPKVGTRDFSEKKQMS